MIKKYEAQDDLPKRSNPNYMRLYRKKHKERLKQTQKIWLDKRVKEYPKYYDDRYERYGREYRKKYTEKNKHIINEKRWLDWGIFDMTHNKYLSELRKQKGKCKICGKKMVRPHVDHDHETGLYRGLLCGSCNTGLGTYEKKKDLFEEYLNGHVLG